MRKKASEIKISGATFTPRRLADFLSEKAICYLREQEEYMILDPACGDGELLESLANALHARGKRVKLVGYDTNDSYLRIARERLHKFNSRLVHKDFLSHFDFSVQENELFGSKDQIGDQFDVVIANPPYVRTQLLGRDVSQSLAKRFNLSGKVDLYQPFLMGMTKSLKVGGVLSVITSNKYLFNVSGRNTREYLRKNFEICEIVDLGDTKLFSAAVLPAIFIGKKSIRESNLIEGRFTKIYESFIRKAEIPNPIMPSNDIYDIVTSAGDGTYSLNNQIYLKSSGKLRLHERDLTNWAFLSEDDLDLVEKVNTNKGAVVADYFKVRVGIKTTADKVFISDNWEGLGKDIPEAELLRPLISQENIVQWSAADNLSLRVLYTHTYDNGKKSVINLAKYPKAKRYLNSHFDILNARKYIHEAKRQWFEIWVPQNPADWGKPKLVFPDISSGPRFCFDGSGKIVNGNCYWIAANSEKEVSVLLLIQGIANSKLITEYHDKMFNNKLYSGKRRYITQYVERYPVPNLELPESREIIDLVRKLNSEEDKTRIIRIQDRVEKLVEQVFGVV